MILDTIPEKVKGFLLTPVESFRNARADGTDTAAPYLVALLVIHAILAAIISFVGISTMGMFGQMKLGLALPVIVFFGVLICGAVLTLVFSLWLHLWVYILGGRKGLLQTVKAVIYGMTPTMLLGWIPFLGFLFFLWSIVLQIIGIRELQEINSGKALVAMIIAVMVPLILLVLIAMYFFIGAVSYAALPAPPLNMYN
jgi:hypothetical protein